MASKIKKPENWNNDTLKAVVRPEILKSNNEKIDLAKRWEKVNAIKKGKGSLDDLPAGFAQSIKNKEKLLSIINEGQETDPASIREKLNIQKKPTTLKTARIQREEILERFEKNRNKLGTKGMSSDIRDGLGIDKAIKENFEKTVDKINQNRIAISKKNKEQLVREPKKAATEKAKASLKSSSKTNTTKKTTAKKTK